MLTDRERRLAAALYVAWLEIQYLEWALMCLGRSSYFRRYRRPLPPRMASQDTMHPTRERPT